MQDTFRDELKLLIEQIVKGQSDLTLQVQKVGARIVTVEKTMMTTEDLDRHIDRMSDRFMETLQHKLDIHQRDAFKHADDLHALAMNKIAEVDAKVNINDIQNKPMRAVWDKVRDIAIGVVVMAVLSLIFVNK